ncbi:thiol reductant ABC exporter subunit CydC [Umezawaea sp. NPDC059074]|uniref:thiol reductant ABC exporter subunit CydC n=1 Tax=Umezawaea sp. NPDC059074 TaxID=3346716 RepID=UPI003679D44E
MKRAVLFAVLAELCAVGLTAAAAWLITRAAQQPSIAALGLAIVAVRGFALCRGAFRYVERLTGHDAALRATAARRGTLFDALVRQRATYRDGDLLTRLVTDTEAVQDLLIRCLLPAATAVAVSAATITVSVVLLPATAPVLAAGLVLGGVLLPAVAAWTARGSAVAEARARLASAALDLVDGADDLAVFGAVDAARDRARGHAADLAAAERSVALVSGLTAAAGVLVQGLTAAAVVLVTVRSGADFVLVAVLGLTAAAAVDAVLPLVEAARRLVDLRPATARTRAVLAAPDAVTTATRPGPISLRGVRVVYDRPAVDGVDLDIAEGRSVAVVGASGAGKSTLLHVLAGLTAPHEGTAALPPSRALTQDAHVFRTSIRANLTLARPDATDTQIAEALRLAGWHEPSWDIDSDGQLSGGQRQRLLLARALLADPPVLLLDEPVEGLETDLADAVLSGVLAARAGRTTIVVTHRLAPLHLVDEVLVLDEGRVVDRGPHRVLVDRPGPYRDLWLSEVLSEGQCRAVHERGRQVAPHHRTPLHDGEPAPQ